MYMFSQLLRGIASDVCLYIYSPAQIWLIARCLRKLENDGALDLFVLPLWPITAQARWPLLLNLLIATPVILLQHEDLMTLPHKGTKHALRHQST